ILVHYLWRRIPPWAVFVMAFFALAIGNTLGSWRRQGLDPHFEAQPLQMQSLRPSDILVEHDEDRQRMGALAVVFHYFPDREDYLMGESWLGAIVAPIPRWLWADKMGSFRWRETAIVYEL